MFLCVVRVLSARRGRYFNLYLKCIFTNNYTKYTKIQNIYSLEDCSLGSCSGEDLPRQRQPRVLLLRRVEEFAVTRKSTDLMSPEKKALSSLFPRNIFVLIYMQIKCKTAGNGLCQTGRFCAGGDNHCEKSIIR